MKRKIKRIGPGKCLEDTLKGIAHFRIVGPHPETKEKVVKVIYGTRRHAETLYLG